MAADPAFGVPPEMLHRAWTISDVMAFAGLRRTAAYRLMQRTDAPRRLNTGGAHRWNGTEVLAYLHSEPSESAITAPDAPQEPQSMLLAVGGSEVARSTGVTPDGVATFAVDPKEVAARTRRTRISGVLRPDEASAWAVTAGVSA